MLQLLHYLLKRFYFSKLQTQSKFYLNGFSARVKFLVAKKTSDRFDRCRENANSLFHLVSASISVDRNSNFDGTFFWSGTAGYGTIGCNY